jgi:hypothetical protein
MRQEQRIPRLLFFSCSFHLSEKMLYYKCFGSFCKAQDYFEGARQQSCARKSEAAAQVEQLWGGAGEARKGRAQLYGSIV